MAKDGGPFQQYLIPMVTLGRNFSLGDVYEYRKDLVMTDNQLSWGKPALASATRIEYKSEKRFLRESQFANQSSMMGLDSHLQLSVAVGFLAEFKGASNYINDSPNPAEATFTFGLRLKCKEEHLDLETLVNQQVPSLFGVVSGATHIVTSVFYGAEAYCVFSQYVDGGEDDEEAKKEIVDNLSKMAIKWENALAGNQDLADFKKQFDKKEKYHLSHTKCRLYADLQMEPVIECDFFDAYDRVLGLMKSLFTSKVGKSKAIPIAITLCPLKVLLDEKDRNLRIDFRDVDSVYESRCSRLLVDLKRVVNKAEVLSNDNKGSPICSKLQEFVNTVLKYYQDLMTSLKKSVYRSRISTDDYVEKEIDGAERHPILKPSKLEEWLNYKRAELDMMDAMETRIGTGIILANRSQLAQHLKVCNTFSIVLYVPSLDDTTNSILAFMKRSDSHLFSEHEEEDQVRVDCSAPWFFIQSQRKTVLDKISQLANHVEKNKLFGKQLQFIVTFSESSKRFPCSFSIYEGGRLLKVNLRRLPGPPTGLRILRPVGTDLSSICVDWDYDVPDYPCQFLVEYRLRGSSDWIQQKTTKPDQTQLLIKFEPESTMEFRVAADTCIGRSEFSDVIDTISGFVDLESKAQQVALDPPFNLQVTSITRTTAKLEWEISSDMENSACLVYIKCWKVDEVASSQEFELENHHSYFIFENLEPDCKYYVYSMIVNPDQSKTSEPSDIIDFTTLEKDFRYCEAFVEKCKKIHRKNGLNLYAVPFTKLDGRFETAECFVIGEPDVNKKRNHRTILLIASSNSGKETFINNIVNYIFNVNLDDPFRFQLIDPSLEEDGGIRVYDIHHSEGFRIDFSLTIIDTPSFCYDNELMGNRDIGDKIKKFFDERNAIPEVDMVGFVMDSAESEVRPSQVCAYVSLGRIFGKGRKKEFNVIFNFAEKHDPSSLLANISESLFGCKTSGPPNHHFKFDSSVFTRSHRGRNKLKAESAKWMEAFESFFSSFHSMKIASKPLLDKKKRLEATVFGMHARMETDLYKFLELSALKKELYKKHATFEMGVATEHRVTLPFGQYVTNCTKCQVTCHFGCGIDDSVKDGCLVIDNSVPLNPTCRVCPEHCSWAAHSFDSFKWDYYPERQVTSLNAIKQKYELKLSKKLTSDELYKEVNKDLESKTSSLEKLFETAMDVIQRLNEIDPYSTGSIERYLKLNFSIIHYINQILNSQDEKTDSIDCWVLSVNKLIELRQRAYINIGDDDSGVPNILRNRMKSRQREGETEEEEEGEEYETMDDDYTSDEN